MGRKTLHVIKRNGEEEDVNLDKITIRITNLCDGLNMDIIDPLQITLQVKNAIFSGITTVELDDLAAERAALMMTIHPDYAVLAARIAISNLYKETKQVFSEVIEDLYNAVDSDGEKSPLISDKHYKIIKENAERLNSAINYKRDTQFNYFAFKILQESHLLRINNKIAEVPQQLLMRVAIGIHADDIGAAIETYNLMSERLFIHASSTLKAAATPNPQMCSSFLLAMPEDSLPGIFNCITQCALITKKIGGIGLHLHNIRAKGTLIAGTGGLSSGLVPMLRVFNNAAISVEQGNLGKTGAITIYLEPWHSDVIDFLNLKKFSGKEEYRAKDLHYALWVPDLFMKRVKADQKWSLMCPCQCPGLHDTYGDEFEKLYEKYEADGKFVRQIDARVLWKNICLTQIETGGSPHILYKDACNRKSNQKNLGPIKSGDFSTEIIQYSDNQEIGSACKASIALNNFVDDSVFNFKKLKDVTKVVTKNLNKILDNNTYPLKEAERAALKHRPIAIGVQGLADTFILLRIPYESEKARNLNRQIFETLYYGALEASCELAEKYGPYSTYKGSPISQGLLQYDLWGVTPTDLWNWSFLKEKIAKYGVRNSLLLALMPTSIVAPILGNHESTEPLHSNVYTQSISSGGKFQVVNHHLIKDLAKADLWSEEMRQKIISRKGSIQTIAEIPEDLKLLYKTVWEISQKKVIDMAADRGAFIDQSQAMNIFIPSANYQVMTSMHFYGFEKGLKTGLYNLKFKMAAGKKLMEDDEEPLGKDDQLDDKELAKLVCSIDNPGACEMCSS